MHLEWEDSLLGYKGKNGQAIHPDDNSIRVLVGSGQNSSCDGTQDSCSFKQIERICSIDRLCLLQMFPLEK